MKKYTIKQEKRIREINDRMSKINAQVDRQIDTDVDISLNLVLEAQFLNLCKRGIELEAKIAVLKRLRSEKDPNTDDSIGLIDFDIERFNKDLLFLKGRISESQQIGNMLLSFAKMGRSFTVRLTDKTSL